MSAFNWLGEASKVRDENGELPSHAWPGGYIVYYVYQDGGQCCGKCANALDAKHTEDLAFSRGDDGGYSVVEIANGMYPRIDGWASPGNTEDLPTEEDGPIICDNCNAVICEVEPA